MMSLKTQESNNKMSLQLKVLTLNCWGIPMISKDRKQRMLAIAGVLANSDYDFVTLQEVWSLSDYTLIADKVKKTLPHSHYYHSGVFGSGICLFSKHMFQEVCFHQWPLNGYVHKFQHGDWFGGKGVTLARFEIKGYNVNIYSAHLHAEYNSVSDEYVAHRLLQAFDTAQFIRLTSSNADVIVLAGDLNIEQGSLTYRMLTSATGLIDSFTQKKNDSRFLFTNDHYQNSYTPENLIREKFAGKRIDYIMYRPNMNHTVDLKKYEHPFPERIPGKEISYSDHEGVVACLELSPKNGRNPDPSTETYEKVLLESIKVLNDAMTSLCGHKRFYLVLALTLFFLMMFTVGMDTPLGLTKIFYIIRIVVTGFMFFALVMGTLWNNIEYHAMLACKLSMEIDLNGTLAKKEKPVNLF